LHHLALLIYMITLYLWAWVLSFYINEI